MNWSGLGAALVGVDARWAALAWSLSLAVIGGLALRWQLFLRRQDVRLPFKTIFSLTWAGQFFNSFLPGSTGGDLVKIYQLCRLVPDRKAVGAATVIADRLSAVAALLILAAVAVTVEPAPLHFLSGVALPVKTMLAGLLMLSAAGWIAFRVLRPSTLVARLRSILVACKGVLAFNTTLAAAFLLAFAIHLLNFLIVYLFARALGLSLTFPQILAMMPVILFLLMVPATINGHGLRELLLIAYFSYLGITLHGHADSGVQEQAVALSLLIVANDLLWSLPGGLWYLTHFRTPRHGKLVVAGT